MKRTHFTLSIAFIALLVNCISCDNNPQLNEETRASDISFSPNEIDVYINKETDIVSFEYMRILPNTDGDIQVDYRGLAEDSKSEAKIGVHYFVDTHVHTNYFLVYFEPNEVRGRYDGLHVIPSSIDRNMKLVLKNQFMDNALLTINLIVNKEV